ncbi:hypothetical protein TTHERM_000762999 (macronuclear) [Tetrahymena thermophila SB210]|uniref:Uncharacterized protein n=1 Tax=Tetrahymena thermophila (strain SB210) TaxID=312017 RepID=W7X1V0_TETTS|nr:hypothetical protein TTHERM_000762999 [Tetrahymena thermophila SB210]EWS71607.1 hypothetical protein TTHERM_000762999 [Tetrahymena thermophila SB210]|eukprot:XP_012655852.1 hypothetical protein TTHERM_000762999 [Tetrahymena thermophila SB210]
MILYCIIINGKNCDSNNPSKQGILLFKKYIKHNSKNFIIPISKPCLAIRKFKSSFSQLIKGIQRCKNPENYKYR